MERTEAIEVIRKCWPVNRNGVLSEALETLIPELKESEDEMIRKEIRNFLIDMECKKEWISYLEKQKEQKPLSTEETELNSIAFLEQMGYTCIPPEKEQKTVESTALQKAFISSKTDYTLEEKCDASDYAEAVLSTSIVYGENEEEYKLHKIIEAAFIAGQKKEQKPAEWSKEDEKLLDFWSDVIDRNDWRMDENFCKASREFISRLKSIRLQQQQNMSICFMLYLDEHRPDGKMCLSNAECNQIETAFKNQDWDIILQYAKKYLPHWKPSEEQMVALMLAIKGKCAPTSYMSRRLEDLYEALVNEFHVECKLDK